MSHRISISTKELGTISACLGIAIDCWRAGKVGESVRDVRCREASTEDGCGGRGGLDVPNQANEVRLL